MCCHFQEKGPAEAERGMRTFKGYVEKQWFGLTCFSCILGVKDKVVIGEVMHDDNSARSVP